MYSVKVKGMTGIRDWSLRLKSASYTKIMSGEFLNNYNRNKLGSRLFCCTQLARCIISLSIGVSHFRFSFGKFHTGLVHFAKVPQLYLIQILYKSNWSTRTDMQTDVNRNFSMPYIHLPVIHASFFFFSTVVAKRYKQFSWMGMQRWPTWIHSLSLAEQYTQLV